MDLVRDKKTKEPMSRAGCQRIFHECLKRGLLTMTYTHRVRIQPAMTIDQDTIDTATAILAEVFDLIANEGSWK
jgi:4-aminobutyrate aminotransferase-like enzyme